MARPCPQNGRQLDSQKAVAGFPGGVRPEGLPRSRWIDSVLSDLNQIKINISLAQHRNVKNVFTHLKNDVRRTLKRLSITSLLFYSTVCTPSVEAFFSFR